MGGGWSQIELLSSRKQEVDDKDLKDFDIVLKEEKDCFIGGSPHCQGVQLDA
jgi:hypothetical protein